MDIHAHRLLRYPPTPLCIIPSSLCLASHARSRFPSCTFCSPHISARSTIPRTIIHCAWHLRNDYHELPLGLATRLFAFAFFRSTTTRTRTRTEPQTIIIMIPCLSLSRILIIIVRTHHTSINELSYSPVDHRGAKSPIVSVFVPPIPGLKSTNLLYLFVLHHPLSIVYIIHDYSCTIISTTITTLQLPTSTFYVHPLHYCGFFRLLISVPLLRAEMKVI
jgi:hypothetical protein